MTTIRLEKGMSVDNSAGKHVVVIGAGPAGLTATYELSKRHIAAIVLEQAAIVGGLAKTENY